MIDADHMGGGVGLELFRHHHIHRQHDLAFGGAGRLHDGAGGVEKVFLAEGLAHRLALGGQKGVGHAATDDEEIHLLREIAEEVELARHLGAAHHRRHRALGLLQRG